MSLNSQQLGRFTVSVSHSQLSDPINYDEYEFEPSSEYSFDPFDLDDTMNSTYRIDTFDKSDDEIIDSLVSLIECYPGSIDRIMTANQILMNRLSDRDLTLVSFSESVQQFLHLFDNVDALKERIMEYIIETYAGSIKVNISKLPLAIQFIYTKYATSLLTIKPSKHRSIDYEDFKRFINHCCRSCFNQ